MTYDRLKIDDEPLLDILLAARDGGAMLCAHARTTDYFLDGKTAARARLYASEISRHQPRPGFGSGGFHPVDRHGRR